MTRDLNLAFAGPIVGLTLLALVGLMGCTSVPGAEGTVRATPTDVPSLATVTPTDAPSDSALRPVAELVTAHGAVLGALGTYVMDGAGSDAPWLPFRTIPTVEVGAADTLEIRFADGAAIGDISPVVAKADDTSGAHPQAVSLGSRAADGLSVTVGPLPPGQWVLEARVFRADGRGDGLTYWAVTVR